MTGVLRDAERRSLPCRRTIREQGSLLHQATAGQHGSLIPVKDPVTFAVLLTTALCALLLAAPAQTVSSKYLNDVLMFLDGAYRITLGQVPNVDFHTALGPLSFYLPALGYWLSGRLGAAMPLGMALLMLALAPATIHVLRSRLQPVLAVPVAVFLVLVLAAPVNTGETPSELSFAMYYNRVGWVLLGLLLIMHLEPRWAHRRQGLLDALSAALLVLLMLFTKASYGAVGLAFLALVLLQRAQRRWAAAALGLTLGGGTLVALLWGGLAGHIADLLLAIRVSGSHTLVEYSRFLIGNRGDYLVFTLIAALALWRRPRFTDLLFYGFCAGAGLALLSQNYQTAGVISLYIGVAVAAETFLRHPRTERGSDRALTAAAPLVLLIVLLPMGGTSAAGLGLHAALAATGAGEPLAMPNTRGLRLAELLNEWDHNHNSKYLENLQAGAEALRTLQPPPRKVYVLDFASPYTSLLGLPPPTGDSAWMHNGRNFDEDHYVPPAALLGDVEIVMVPLEPVAEGVTEMLEDIYGDYIDAHFDKVKETERWAIYRRPLALVDDRRP